MTGESGPYDWTGVWAKLALTVLCYYAVILPAYYLWFHPLARYPGPRTWAISQLPWMVMFCSGQSHSHLLELHNQYGRIVRVGPDELSYIVPEAWNAINGRQRDVVENPKAPWFCPPDDGHIAGASNADHARMRYVLADAFSTRAIAQQQSLISGYVDLLIRRLHEKAQDGGAAIDVGSWFNYCAFDIIGDLAFGEPFGCLQGSAMHPWIAMIFGSLRTGAVGAALRRFPVLPSILPLLVPKRLRQLGDDLKRFSAERVAKRISTGSQRPDFIEAMISGKGQMTLSRNEIVNNALVLTVAGSETTATALTGAVYLLATNPQAMGKLEAEICAAFVNEEAIADLNSVARLPYLGAVTQETLRLYPPGPNAQPRITPPQGNTILGDFIPGKALLKTIIGIPQRAMYLSEHNFRRAKHFIPERWLGDQEFAGDRRDCLNAFSVGPRNCIGMNLAYAEFRQILARLLWNFHVTLDEQSLGWLETQRSYLHWDRAPLYVHLRPRQKFYEC
ncbi:cytochrome P450 [Apiospora phragmitis]|uniref:Cytochrome P450 n=1 Tax=Apiospora phragmitis TaxID=2905665 RepID=A0ABR1UMB6_9PEZI